MRRRILGRVRFGVLVVLAAWLPATLALADARVDVEVKDAVGRLATAQVTLTAGRVTKSCSTVGGRCSITLAAGNYQVHLQPPNGGAPVTSQVTVPASGSIRLALRLPASSAPPPSTASKPSGSTQAQGVTTNLRNFSSGRTLHVQGSVLDPAGRLANATITLEQGGRAIGTASCVGGRFSMFDVPAGAYQLVAVAANGARVTAGLTVSNTVAKPTLCLPAR
jgi:hypothetical protein